MWCCKIYLRDLSLQGSSGPTLISFSGCKNLNHAHFQVYVITLGLNWNISAWLTVTKTPYLSYTGSLYSPSVQPLSETGCFIVPSRPPSEFVMADFQHLRRQHKQRLVAGFHFFFLFFTQNGNFSHTSRHVCAWIRYGIWMNNKGYRRDGHLWAWAKNMMSLQAKLR